MKKAFNLAVFLLALSLLAGCVTPEKGSGPESLSSPFSGNALIGTAEPFPGLKVVATYFQVEPGYQCEKPGVAEPIASYVEKLEFYSNGTAALKGNLCEPKDTAVDLDRVEYSYESNFLVGLNAKQAFGAGIFENLEKAPTATSSTEVWCKPAVALNPTDPRLAGVEVVIHRTYDPRRRADRLTLNVYKKYRNGTIEKGEPFPTVRTDQGEIREYRTTMLAGDGKPKFSTEIDLSKPDSSLIKYNGTVHFAGDQVGTHDLDLLCRVVK